MTVVESRRIPFDAHTSGPEFTPHSYEQYRRVFGEDFEDRIRAAVRELGIKEEITFLREDDPRRKHDGSVAEYVIEQDVWRGLGVAYGSIYVPQIVRPGGSSRHSHDGREFYRGVFGKVVIYINNLPNVLVAGATLPIPRGALHQVSALDEWSAIVMVTENPNRLPRELLHRKAP